MLPQSVGKGPHKTQKSKSARRKWSTTSEMIPCENPQNPQKQRPEPWHDTSERIGGLFSRLDDGSAFPDISRSAAAFIRGLESGRVFQVFCTKGLFKIWDRDLQLVFDSRPFIDLVVDSKLNFDR